MLVLILTAAPCAAAVCNPADFHGVYGFQLAGTTTISAAPQPVVGVGRLIFHDDGTVDGVSSISFTGLYLGNPITGTFQAKTDCSVAWSLQDDSGNHQNFLGTIAPDGRRVEFKQTDTGASQRGVLLKAAESCQDADFQPRYHFSITGKRVDVDTAKVDGSVSFSGVIERHGGDVTLILEDDPSQMTTGTVEVDDDCFVHFDLMLPAGAGKTSEMKFRGILVDGGKQLLGMATDPGSALRLRLTMP